MVDNRNFLSDDDRALTDYDTGLQRIQAGGGTPTVRGGQVPGMDQAYQAELKRRQQGRGPELSPFEILKQKAGNAVSAVKNVFSDENLTEAAFIGDEGFKSAQENLRNYANENAIGTPGREFNTPINYIRSVDPQTGQTVQRPGYTNQAVDNANYTRLTELANGINTAPTSAILDLMFPGGRASSGGQAAPAGRQPNINTDRLNAEGVPFVTTLGDSGNQTNPLMDMLEQAQRFRDQATRSNSLGTTAGLIGQARSLENAIGDFAGIDKANIAANTAIQNNLRDTAGTENYRNAAALEAQMRAARLSVPETKDFDIDYYNALLDREGGEAAADMYLKQHYRQSFAQGGIVSSALGSAGISAPQMAEVQAYQQYADSARAMGLTTVPFEKFLEMRMGAGAMSGAAGKGVVGMADGGTVPEVAGKMVVDPNPDAPVDSIPATIDGEQPAALNSGEFVIPTDVVLFYGTDKLNKMIEKAREPKNGNNAGNAGAAGVSAIAAATQ